MRHNVQFEYLRTLRSHNRQLVGTTEVALRELLEDGVLDGRAYRVRNCCEPCEP